MTSKFLGKQIKRITKDVKLGGEATQWEGSFMRTPARHGLRNTTYIHDFRPPQPTNQELAPWPIPPKRGTTKPE
jgi:hypothetical protein